MRNMITLAKKYLLISLLLLLETSLIGQTPQVTLPGDGNWPTIVGDSIMLIGPKQEALTEEQRYFNPPYLLVYPGKEHLKNDMIRAALCDCDPSKPNRRIGVFSVAPGKQVSFSQGNLQYLPAANLWKFADTQYEYLGNANKYLTPSFRNWVDLFGWSANNTTAPFGVSTSTNAADYAGDFVDWGTNEICGDAPNTWRTLSIDEWKYLYHERPNAEKLFALGTINGIAGMILLPDDWQQPEGVTCKLPTENGLQWNDNYNGGGYINTNTQADHYQDNIYTVEQWQTMEEVGAVFLPAAGYRENTNFSTQSVNPPSDYVGSYATSTITDGNNYYFMRFIHREVRKYSHLLARGRSVRLVHDTIVPKPKPGRRIGVFSVAADKQVSFSQGNLQYIQSRDEWRFAENQYDFIGEDNIKDGKLANRIDLFGWSANNTTAPFGISTSINDADYKGAFVDWGTNIIQSDASGTWRTLSSEEWEYLRNGRLNAQQLLGIACVNGINGLILLPDNCVLPDDFHFKCGTHTLYGEEYFKEVNDYTLDEWLVLQQLEAVFLPASGTCIGINYQNSRKGGSYYSSSPSSEYYACIFNLRSNITRTMSGQSRHIARSVRLVHDTIVPETIPDPCLVVKVNDTLSINMMCVEGGTFMMGDGENAHPVSLSSYSIGQTEVTQALWEAVMGTNPSANTANKQLPVIKISWYDCQEFIKKLNQQTGMRFRLPTEAEWEYAARDGQKSKGYTYAGSNDLKEVAWYNGNSGNRLHAVAQKKPNELGIYDMSGNAWEWCEDYYDTDETMHVVKSGSFYDYESACRIDSRTGRAADYKSFIGLRLVLDERSTPPEPEYVDLGLSVKWATFNVGATAPEEIGDFYAWGETEPKDSYSVGNYKWWNGSSQEITKYCTFDTIAYGGIADGLTELQQQDDVAHILKGEHWRMPNLDECKELVKGCTWTVSTRQGQIGFEGKSKINGNTIFLPVAGFRAGTNVVHETIGGYWASTLNIDKQSCAMGLYLNEETPAVGIYYNSSRQNGFLIRPVYDDIPDPCLVVKVNDTLSINMMCVEGGTFMMGAMEGDTQAYDNEKPAHEVTLTYNYYIAQTEVTQALWKAVMGNNPSTMIGDDLPVNNVLWDEADAFVKRLSQMTGYTFHLPTEAEWEFAARGGKESKGYLYAGNDDVDEVAWYADNSGGKTHAVGTKKPNELGIYDMSGNAWEWCSDWLAPYSAEPQVNPIGPATGEYHVYRGGGWEHGTRFTRSSHRRTTTQGYVKTALGLRVAIREKIEPEAVDLGLSIKWANFNIGAFDPTHYGDYFAWGETEPKETYSWATYKWCDGTDANITKYNSADGKTILEPADDAAQVHWGGKWRMPTKEEIEELIDNCTWSESIQNGVKGYVVTSKHTGNSIFFPYSGYFNHDNSATLQGEKTLFYTWSAEHSDNTRGYDIHNRAGAILLEQNTRRCGFPIRPVYDDRPTLTVIPTQEDANVSFLCTGYHAQGHSITVDIGKNVLYQVTNVDAGYLSQGDSIYKLTKDSVLHITLRPFSDGNWVVVDKSEYTKQEGYYVSRNNGGFAAHSVWNYYVLPVLPGETYRVRGIAGQHAALWMAASTAPDPATNTRPTKISCCANRGVAAYVADEVTIPDGAKYLIINSRNGKEMMVERKVPDPCLVVKVNDTLSINMMCVEGGTFRMGAMEGDTLAREAEKPVHDVTLTYDYLIMQTEVTQGMWQAIMGEDIYDLISKSSTPNAKPISTKGNFPVGYVLRTQCLQFIDRLNALTGLHFRLPSEAEWEYAARGGNKSKGYLYAGSNKLTQVAQTNLGTVGQLQPNELGIYDMSGNVAEMTFDYLPDHETGYPSANPRVNPRSIYPFGNRAVRGLRWYTTEINTRISHRSAYSPGYCSPGMGFRLVLPIEQDYRTILVNGSFFDMVFVEGGTFMMGSDAPDAQSDEKPVHEVTLSDYYIGQTEVTQHLWNAVMGSNPSTVKGNNLPVTDISWDDAQLFVQKLSEMTGLYFRLPTEAEWEYAARGGQKSEGYKYAGSNDINEVGWYNNNSSNKTQAIGQKLQNELGIYDMTGNVWEYCYDWHTPYTDQAQTNPTGAATGEKHVLRGGCYHYDSKNCTNTNRHSYYTPDKGGASTGLRIVLDEDRYYRYGYTQEDWNAATSSWGHQGRGHAPADQSCIQGTMVHGIRLKVAKAGSLNVYKVPSLLEKNEDHFELVATLTTDRTGVQDFDFAEAIYIAPNECLVLGKPSEEEPTLRPYWLSGNASGLPEKSKGVAHYIGTKKAEVAAPNGSLMVEFY